MPPAVLDAYGWTDIQPACEFILDYEDEDDEETAGRPTRRRRPWRCRWPDDIRDEVLGRLLALNARRAQEEQATGAPRHGRGRTQVRNRKQPVCPGDYWRSCDRRRPIMVWSENQCHPPVLP